MIFIVTTNIDMSMLWSLFHLEVLESRFPRNVGGTDILHYNHTPLIYSYEACAVQRQEWNILIHYIPTNALL